MPDGEVTFTGIGSPIPWEVPAGVIEIGVTAKSPRPNRFTSDDVQRAVLITGRLPVTPGEILNIRIGGAPVFFSGSDEPDPIGGYNGGGDAGINAGGGGDHIIGEGGCGATDIRQGGDALANRVVVCGGPGGLGIGSADAGEYVDGFVARDPAVDDGNYPRVPPIVIDRQTDITGNQATQAPSLVPGSGGLVKHTGGVYTYGVEGEAGDTDGVGEGGDGGDGVADYTVPDTSIETGGLSGPVVLSNISLLNTYVSGPRDVYGPFTIPAWGLFKVQTLSFDNTTDDVTLVALGCLGTTAPDSGTTAFSASTYPGLGPIQGFENLTGAELDIYLWVYYAFGSGTTNYEVRWTLEQGPINPGSGGGGGYHGGAGGSSNVDEGYNLPIPFQTRLTPDGRNGGGGGGGSSFSALLKTVYSQEPWDSPYNNPGFVTLTWDLCRAIPPLHIPHKLWATPVSAQENENYLAIERWAQRLTTCDIPPLHIPHKEWSTAEEHANYLAIEQWVAAEPLQHPLHIPHNEYATPFERENYYTIERWARLYFY